MMQNSRILDRNSGTCTYNQMKHFYVDIPAPSLHGNNSEIGAKTVNIKMIHPVIYHGAVKNSGAIGRVSIPWMFARA